MSKANKDTADKTIIQSVVKSLNVLELLSSHPKGMQVKEICITLNINISSTYHIINTLLLTGYIQKVENERYKVGHKIPFLYHKYSQSSVPSFSLSQILSQLHEETKETCYLGTEQGGDIIISEIKESVQALRVSALHVGYKDYAHARASTKIIMAYWPEEKIRSYFKRNPMQKLTASTITDTDELIKELAGVREQGYCLDEEDFVEGVCCISAPVYDDAGEIIASYSVSLPAERYAIRRLESISIVRKAASKASALLGHVAESDS